MAMERKGVHSVTVALLAGCVLIGARAEAQHYTQTNLISDEMGQAANQDPNLVNPWGLSRSSTSPWWVANNGTGTATLYNGSTGLPVSLVVTIPPATGSDPGVPTGTVFNGTPAFELAPGKTARFLFATEDGTISGWNPAVDATHAVIKVTSKHAVYKGLAIATHGGAWFLYATNFAKGRIDVFDSSFHAVSLPGGDGHHVAMAEEFGGDRDEHGAFRDERLPRGYSPFGIQNIGGDLYVTFAKTQEGSTDEQHGTGFGYVDVFSPSGRLLRRLEHGDWLNAPWGLALAPGDFGAFSHNLLVGQFGSGAVAAYDVASGRFLGEMKDMTDKVLMIDGLWALAFGNGSSAGPLNTLFFTAGIDDEGHGLFGTLTAPTAEQLLGNGQ
ncbi:MAG TPA: TIGR03118 family protein [Vicinamibacteria bacterium]|nr:TIGR03118 family protein [Vicinamibacteria bacterium]